mmetsp:Transcript_1283/g.2974  ORF Transcript_1283/g.2974 Transcript_1283/m.2974 type:complete len:338 (-) Transcript_1283:73-1086(-)
MLNTNITNIIITNAQSRQEMDLMMANSMVRRLRSHFTVRTRRTTRISLKTRQMRRKDMLAKREGTMTSTAAFPTKKRSNMFQCQFLPMKKLVRKAIKFSNISTENHTRKTHSNKFSISAGVWPCTLEKLFLICWSVRSPMYTAFAMMASMLTVLKNKVFTKLWKTFAPVYSSDSSFMRFQVCSHSARLNVVSSANLVSVISCSRCETSVSKCMLLASKYSTSDSSASSSSSVVATRDGTPSSRNSLSAGLPSGSGIQGWRAGGGSGSLPGSITSSGLSGSRKTSLTRGRFCACSAASTSGVDTQLETSRLSPMEPSFKRKDAFSISSDWLSVCSCLQ